ncbi:hypothetical protein [Taibaiella koreensis]|uniref:hypothetical protein n=1 Tax=Taibaiella koreensis TaxID=1268548 RepID=UPI000E59C34A|nr:hypothetical protein [Taibaiella koreensis]
MTANQSYPERNVVTMKDLILNLKKWASYLLSKWKIIIALMIIGAAAGFFYAKSKAFLYKAESTFVLDEGKSGGNAMSGLALLGIDAGNASAGLFSSTKNIVWLYKSRLMLFQALVTPVNYNGQRRLLVDIFLDESGIRKKSKLGTVAIKENVPLDSLSKEQSSLMLSCIEMLKGNKYLDINETSKAENLITVIFKSKDEQFSKLFTEVLVSKVNQYYIKTKTEKTTEEIKVLESKADSARLILNSGMYQVASSIEDVPYANPARATLRVAPERKKIDVDATTTMYLELTKNLETRRMALAQETPLIQMVDGPVYPLIVIKASGIQFAIIGAVLFLLFTTAILMLRKWYQNIMNT